MRAGLSLLTDLEIEVHGQASQLGIDLNPETVEKFAILSIELCKWNRAQNLTGHNNEKRIIGDLIMDAVVTEKFINGEDVLDIGSGAGFPGIVMAIGNSNLKVVSLESKGKKIAFQKHVSRMLEIEGRFEPVQGRAGETDLNGRRFDCVTVKAVGTMEKSIELGMGYLKKHGRVIMPRAIRDKEKAEELGLSVRMYKLPKIKEERAMVIYEK